MSWHPSGRLLLLCAQIFPRNTFNILYHSMQQLQEADQVSRHLWVGNLAADADRGTLINVAQAFGPLQDVTTFDGMSFAFISFSSVQPACRAFELLDGQQVG